LTYLTKDEFKFSGTEIEKQLKQILANRLKGLKALLIKYPFVFKEKPNIENSIDDVIQLIEHEDYKKAILVVKELYDEVEETIENVEKEVQGLRISKEAYRGEVFDRVKALIEKMDETERQLYDLKMFNEEEEEKQLEQRRKIREGTYAEGSNESYNQSKPSKPVKNNQIGISKPIIDKENRSFTFEVPEEEAEEQEEDKANFLSDAFKGLNDEEKSRFLTSITKSKELSRW